MTKGILLLAWGKRGYGFMAYNLALSIKYHSPNIPIHLLCDSGCMREVVDKTVFDNIEWINEQVTDPAKFKVAIYPHLPFDVTMYLDVDALCLRPVEGLFDQFIESGDYYQTFVHGFYDETSPIDMPLMYWCRRDFIWNHYGLSDHVLPATQSSIQIIKKSDQAQLLFENLVNNLKNPIPIHKLTHSWGGTQPDELYLNVALAQVNCQSKLPETSMWFGDNISKKPHQLSHEYTFLSLYGNKFKTRQLFWDYYDGVISNLSKQKGMIPFKSDVIRSDKHANGKNKNTRPIARVNNKPFNPPIPPVPVEAKTEGTVYLFTSFFTTNNQLRNAELERVMSLNIANNHIDKIFNLSDVKVSHEKVVNIECDRPSFRDFVRAANLANGDYSIIANSDIYFDSTIELAKKHLTEDTCYALSRYDIKKHNRSRLFNYEFSQDSWFFKGKIKEPISIDFVMGKPACDNRFAYELNLIGYNVINPAHQIKTYHLHMIPIRNYSEDDRLKGEVLAIPVTHKLTYDYDHSER